MSTPSNTDLVKSTAIAKRYAISARTVLNLVERGDIPGVRVGSQWRFDEAAVAAAMDARTADRFRRQKPAKAEPQPAVS